MKNYSNSRQLCGVPTRFIQTLLRMVGDKGYDFSVILNDAGLDFDPLDHFSDHKPKLDR